MNRTRKADPDLDVRSREVLREIVMQYVQNGEPISSRTLARSGHFDLSSASLRNVMADLEDLGFLHQPHTSAGRVPTDLGYRFFINNLMKTRRPTQHERSVIDEQMARASELEEVMQIASRVLSELTEQVGVAFIPSIGHFVMRSLDLIPLAERKVMCVIVGNNGVAINKMIETAEPYAREDLERIGRFITHEFGGRPLHEVRNSLRGLQNHDRARYDELLRKASSLGVDAVDETMPSEHELFVEGMVSMLQKKDFDADAIRRSLHAFDEREKLVEILSGCLEEEGVQILLGEESTYTRNYNFALVAARYASGDRPIGLVGIIGPTRMEYARVAPLVGYLGSALTRKIEERQEDERE